jgi:hypothetical protein
MIALVVLEDGHGYKSWLDVVPVGKHRDRVLPEKSFILKLHDEQRVTLAFVITDSKRRVRYIYLFSHSIIQIGSIDLKHMSGYFISHSETVFVW